MIVVDNSNIIFNCVLTNLFVITVVVEVVMGVVTGAGITEMVVLTDISMVETVRVHIERISRSSTFYVMKIVVLRIFVFVLEGS